jgi:hypothetical protein
MEAAMSGPAADARPAAEAGTGSAAGVPPAARLAPEQMPAAWKVLARVAGKQLEDHYTPVAYVEHVGTDTQVSQLGKGLDSRKLPQHMARGMSMQ